MRRLTHRQRLFLDNEFNARSNFPHGSKYDNLTATYGLLLSQEMADNFNAKFIREYSLETLNVLWHEREEACCVQGATVSGFRTHLLYE